MFIYKIINWIKKLNEETKLHMRHKHKLSPEGRKVLADKVPYTGKSVICIETGEEFKSAKKAAISMGYPRSTSHVSHCCNGRRKIACGGLRWK